MQTNEVQLFLFFFYPDILFNSIGKVKSPKYKKGIVSINPILFEGMF